MAGISALTVVYMPILNTFCTECINHVHTGSGAARRAVRLQVVPGTIMARFVCRELRFLELVTIIRSIYFHKLAARHARAVFNKTSTIRIRFIIGGTVW